jgi:hypothetical protein
MFITVDGFSINADSGVSRDIDQAVGGLVQDLDATFCDNFH